MRSFHVVRCTSKMCLELCVITVMLHMIKQQLGLKRKCHESRVKTMQRGPKLSTSDVVESLESVDWLHSLFISILTALESSLPRAPPARRGENMID